MPETILIVDDDKEFREEFREFLSGYEIREAANGQEALDILRKAHDVDLMILDVNMPGLGGAGTLPRLRALRPSLPVLLATGRADQTAQDLVQGHPFVTLLSKPFGMKELQAQLAPHLS